MPTNFKAFREFCEWSDDCRDPKAPRVPGSTSSVKSHGQRKEENRKALLMRVIGGVMAGAVLLVLLSVMALLSSCAGVPPVAVSYTGAAAGHAFTVGYSGKAGVGVVISQK